MCSLIWLCLLCNTVFGSYKYIDPEKKQYSDVICIDMSHYVQRKRCSSAVKEFQDRNSLPEVFLEKGVVKICSKFTGEHPCQSVISIKLQSNFIKITLCHGCLPVNLLYIFRTPFYKNTSEGLLLSAAVEQSYYLKKSS